jgi:N-acyl homoserine lactone hydrolase
MSDVVVRRASFGYFIRPAEETGTGRPRVEPCLGYLVHHPRGTLLFDTGMGSRPDVDAHYRPRRIELAQALAATGARIADIRLATNCHLHFDHCGGNPALGDIPVFVQAAELHTARHTQDYTLPELIDGSRFEPISGQAEILPGVFLVPTPGHTDGHQSLVVRQKNGAVVVAGQSHDTSAQYSADQLAWRARRDARQPAPRTPPAPPEAQPDALAPEAIPVIPDWIDTLQQFDPRMVFFAHDGSVWIP